MVRLQIASSLVQDIGPPTDKGDATDYFLHVPYKVMIFRLRLCMLDKLEGLINQPTMYNFGLIQKVLFDVAEGSEERGLLPLLKSFRLKAPVIRVASFTGSSKVSYKA